MNGSVSISEREGTMWVSHNLMRQGFRARVPLHADTAPIVLVHAKAAFEHVEEGLETILRSVRLCRQLANGYEKRSR